nr:class I SAM-dependent methyltransferase [Acinetobacter baumannii]
MCLNGKSGGTGDLAKVFSREVGPQGHVVLSDINESMLNVGRDRLIDAGCTNVDFVLANAETLEPFADNSFDLVTISFGLRNVTDKDAALASMFRVLKPGGRLLVLESSLNQYLSHSQNFMTSTHSLLYRLEALQLHQLTEFHYLHLSACSQVIA